MLSVTALALALVLSADPEPGSPPAPPCPACPPCPPVPPAPPPKRWTGSVGLGVVAVTGNARSLTANVGAVVEHKGEAFILSGKANATYGESRASGASDTAVSAENAALFLRGDYRVDRRLSTYVLGGVETDHPKSIEVRYSEEAGMGYAWIDWRGDDQKLFLRTDAGFRLAEEYRFQYFPVAAPLDPRDYLFSAPRFAAAFRWEMNKSVLFTQDLEMISNLSDSRVMVNSVSKLNAKLFGPLALGIGYTINYDSAPPLPKIPWDTTLAITLDYLL